MQYARYNQGLSIVEILFGLALFAIVFVFIMQTLTVFFLNHARVLEQTQAVYLAESGQEYVRYLRDDDWNTLDDLLTGVTYYLSVSSSTVATSSSPEVINGKFTRSFILWPAYRDGDDDLVASTTAGATTDAGSFMVVVRVTWGVDEEVQLHSLLTNLQNI